MRAMSINQANSPMCLGCRQPGHTLVDYIVAKGLAQRHLQLCTQVANMHSHFCSRLNLQRNVAFIHSPTSATRPPGGNHTTVRSILSAESAPPTGVDTTYNNASDLEDINPINGNHGYQMNALRGHASFLAPTEFDKFDDCSAALLLQHCRLSASEINSETVSAVTVPFPEECPIAVSVQDPTCFLLRRLAETYNAPSRSVYAYADISSMSCTASNATLLYAYRSLSTSAFNHKVRLYNAGGHGHKPTGVGYLRIPAYSLPPLDAVSDNPPAPCSVFIRTYHTTTIPGIISYSAISKQLKTNGYSTDSHDNHPGFICYSTVAVSQAITTNVYLCIQPTRCRGGLTFTVALILPTADEDVASLPLSANNSDRFILCSASVSPGAPC